MRIAIVCDIHGNRTAFEAVLADLREISPDLILHGGDLADGGSDPASIVDQIRDLQWPGVLGNTDEMLARPESLEQFASETPAMAAFIGPIREMAAAARETLGEERLTWLGALPMTESRENKALCHANPESAWRAPNPEASEQDFAKHFGSLDVRIVVYGHIHRSFLRNAGGKIIANSGSVSLSYDGDPRASYLLIDEGRPEIRRVAYDVDREIAAMKQAARSHWEWIARILKTASPQMP